MSCALPVVMHNSMQALRVPASFASRTGAPSITCSLCLILNRHILLAHHVLVTQSALHSHELSRVLNPSHFVYGRTPCCARPALCSSSAAPVVMYHTTCRVTRAHPAVHSALNLDVYWARLDVACVAVFRSLAFPSVLRRRRDPSQCLHQRPWNS
ncbi:hypothetical protein C8R46DRAFT_1233000 [Mycena filopes]|nr:hypothetical protein C8R46DRAFT_1233000 [Mycena filopes]